MPQNSGPSRSRAIRVAVASAPMVLLSACIAVDDDSEGNGPAPSGEQSESDVFFEQSDYEDVPTSTVPLPDGRIMEVQAGEAHLREDVTVILRDLGNADGTLVVVQSEEETLMASALQPYEQDPVDGVLLLASPIDVPYERGDIEYAEPPRTRAAKVPAGSLVPVTTTGSDTDIVCVEVFSERSGSLLDAPETVPGLIEHVFYRGSEGTLELACAERNPDPPTVTVETWGFERLNIDPLAQEHAELAVDIEFELDEQDDADELLASLTFYDDAGLLVPEDLSTLFVVSGDGRWIWEPLGEYAEVEAGDTYEYIQQIPKEVRYGTDALEMCFLVEADDFTGMACEEVDDW